MLATLYQVVFGVALFLAGIFAGVSGAAVGNGCSDVCDYNEWGRDAQCSALNLRHIPQECRNAKTLCVRDNLITHLSRGTFSNFTSLKYLYLQRNNLTLEEGTFAGCSNVESIELSGNLVPTLTPQMTEGLSSILFLSVDNASVEDVLPDTFKNLLSLRYLSMKYNRLSSPPCSAFAPGSSLQTLYLSNNMISYIPKDCFADTRALTKMYLNDNAMTDINPKAFRGLDSLVYLALHNNMLRRVPAGIFEYASNIETLSLSHNKIEYLSSKDFHILSGLQVLYLQYNRITAIPTWAFRPLVTLRNLNISYNSLGSIEEGAFLGLTQLEELALQNNQIVSTKNITFSEIPVGAKIRLEDNPLFCDCSIYPFMYWLDTNANEDQNHASCMSPQTFTGRLVIDLNRHDLCPGYIDTKPPKTTSRPTGSVGEIFAQQSYTGEGNSSFKELSTVQLIAIIAAIIIVVFIVIGFVFLWWSRNRYRYNLSTRNDHVRRPADTEARPDGNVIYNQEAPALPPRVERNHNNRHVSVSSTAPLLATGYMSPDDLPKCSTAPELTPAIEALDSNDEDDAFYDKVNMENEDGDDGEESVQDWVHRKMSSPTIAQPTDQDFGYPATGYIDRGSAVPAPIVSDVPCIRSGTAAPGQKAHARLDRKSSGYVPHVPSANGNEKA